MLWLSFHDQWVRAWVLYRLVPSLDTCHFHIYLASTWRDEWDQALPVFFFCALLLPCIKLNANQWTKMGEAWEWGYTISTCHVLSPSCAGVFMHQGGTMVVMVPQQYFQLMNCEGFAMQRSPGNMIFTSCRQLLLLAIEVKSWLALGMQKWA